MLQHQARVTVIHDESGRNLGVFRTKAGGGKEGDNQLVRPGGMAPPVAMRGTWAFGEVTVARLLRHGQDSGLVHWVNDHHGERYTCIVQALDDRGREGFHRPESYNGLLNTSTPPEVDADGNDPQTLELALTIDTVA